MHRVWDWYAFAMPLTVEQLQQSLRDLAERLERGENLKAVEIGYWVDGELHEHTFSVETEQERNDVLLAIRIMLGQVH